MKILTTIVLTLVTLIVSPRSALAEDSDVWQNIEIRYVVEIGWVYRDFVDEPWIGWTVYMTTDSFDEAETVFDLLTLALDTGELKAILDPQSFSSPVDVRIRAEFYWIERPMKVRQKSVSKLPPAMPPLTLLEASSL